MFNFAPSVQDNAARRVSTVTRNRIAARTRALKTSIPARRAFVPARMTAYSARAPNSAATQLHFASTTNAASVPGTPAAV